MHTFNVLFFASLCSSMLSVLSLIRNLSPVALHRKANLVMIVSTLVWTLVAVLGSVFQCHPPQVWDVSNGVCIDRVAFYTVLETTNIALEIGLISQPILITWDLQLRSKQKAVVICSFLARTAWVSFVVLSTLLLTYGPVSLSHWSHK